MKKFKFSLKSQIMLSLCMLIAGLLLCVGSLAYFTSHDEVTNTVNAKMPSIALYEPKWDSEGADMAQKAVPGMEIPKDPYIYNNSEAEVYVRMKVELVVDGHTYNSTADPLFQKIFSYIYFDDEIPDGSLLFNPSLGFSECYNPDFNYYDGYFYYASGDTCKALESHKATSKLFDCIKLPVKKTDFNNGIFDKKFTIKVIAEGVSTAVVDDPTVAECAKQFK